MDNQVYKEKLNNTIEVIKKVLEENKEKEPVAYEKIIELEKRREENDQKTKVLNNKNI